MKGESIVQSNSNDSEVFQLAPSWVSESFISATNVLAEMHSREKENHPPKNISLKLKAAIQSLERISRFDEFERGLVFEFIESYIRWEMGNISAEELSKDNIETYSHYEWAFKYNFENPHPIPQHVQFALEVLGRSSPTGRGEVRKIVSPEKSPFEVNFSDLNLQRSRLRALEFFSPIFFEANLSYASFEYARMNGANFMNSNLQLTNFSNVTMKNAYFGCALAQGVNFEDANLEDASFYRGNLTRAQFQSTNLAKTKFSEANLTDALFHNADISQASFYDAELQGAYLSGCNTSGCDFGNANLKGALLAGIDLKEAVGLSSEQIQETIGDGFVKLPEGLDRPTHWYDEGQRFERSDWREWQKSVGYFSKKTPLG